LTLTLCVAGHGGWRHAQVGPEREATADAACTVAGAGDRGAEGGNYFTLTQERSSHFATRPLAISTSAWLTLTFDNNYSIYDIFYAFINCDEHLHLFVTLSN
jgi:hypothetical protein